MISQCKQKCYLKFRNLLITDEKRSWLGTKIMVENPQTSHNTTHSRNERKGTKSTFQAHECGVLPHCTEDYWISGHLIFWTENSVSKPTSVSIFKLKNGGPPPITPIRTSHSQSLYWGQVVYWCDTDPTVTEIMLINGGSVHYSLVLWTSMFKYQ